jgi:ABC-type branched-subunit amino acid transport system substrate-binding protein
MNVLFKKKTTLLLLSVYLLCSADEPIPNIETITSEIKTKMISGRHEIPIGATLPLKGENSVLGSPIFDGMSLFFNKIKTDKIPFMYQLTSLDDQADVQTRRNNINTLIKESPLILSLLGTEALSTNINTIDNGNVLALFPLEGSSTYRTNQHKHLIFFRASHEQELKALVDYSINTLNKKKLAIFYEESEWGQDCLETLKKIVSTYNINLVAEGRYQRNTLNIIKGAKAIVAQDPEAIICVAHARPAYNFIQYVVNQGLHKTVFLCLSSLVSTQSTLRRSRGIPIVTAAVVPDPHKSMLQIAQEFRDDMQKYTPNKPLSPFAFEGYINAALLTECTKQITFPITTEKIISIIEGLKKVRFKGINLNFDPQTRTLSKNVWINTGDPKKEWATWPTHKTKKPTVPVPQKQVIS